MGLRTAAEVRNGDRKGEKRTARNLDSDEQAAIARLLQEG